MQIKTDSIVCGSCVFMIFYLNNSNKKRKKKYIFIKIRYISSALSRLYLHSKFI